LVILFLLYNTIHGVQITVDTTQHTAVLL